MPKGKNLPDEVIDHWPEVFKDIEVDVIPIEYILSIMVTFVDGKVWEIDMNKQKGNVDVEVAIEDLLSTYEDHIANVDFRLNTKKVKDDIKRRTAMFLKKRK